MKTPVVRQALGSNSLETAVSRLAEEILSAAGPRETELALVGIQRRGALLAKRLQEKIEAATGKGVPLGALDITLYRDDLDSGPPQPVVNETHLDFDINDKTIVLVDDVLYTGRTVRAALDELIDFGRPKRIYLAVLVDRGHRELPIAADFVGETIETAAEESVEVRLTETDGKDEVLIVKEGAA